jgi:MFS family permease
MADPTRERRWQVVVLMGANVGAATGLFVHAFLYNFYLASLGHGPVAMGWAQAALAAGGLLGLLPAGRLVDRIGARDTALLGTLLLGAGLALGAFTEAIGPVCLAAALAGAGTAGWRVATGPLMLGLVPPADRARWFSRNVAALLTTGGVSMLAAGAVTARITARFALTPLAAHRVALGSAALCAIAGAAAFLAVARDRPPRAAPQSRGGGAGGARGGGGGGGGAPRDRPPRSARLSRDERSGAPRGPATGIPDTRLLVGVLAVALWMTATSIVSPFFNLYFRDVHRLDVSRIGLLFGAAHLATAAVIAIGAEAATRWGTVRALSGWMLLLAPALLALAAGPAIAVGATLYLVQGLVAPATNPLIDVIVLEAAPRERRGVAASWRNTATELSGVLGPALGGAMLAARGFAGLFVLGAAVAVAGAGALIAWTLSGRPAAPRAAPRPE